MQDQENNQFPIDMYMHQKNHRRQRICFICVFIHLILWFRTQLFPFNTKIHQMPHGIIRAPWPNERRKQSHKDENLEGRATADQSVSTSQRLYSLC